MSTIDGFISVENLTSCITVWFNHNDLALKESIRKVWGKKVFYNNCWLFRLDNVHNSKNLARLEAKFPSFRVKYGDGSYKQF